MGASTATSGLMAMVPGLAKHRTATPAVAVVPPVPNRERAFELLRESVRLLAELYPEQALVWLREYRPDVVAHLRDCEGAVDAAVLSGDLDRTRRTLTRYVSEHQRAFDLFKSRPPVVDTQGDLFHG